MGFLATVDEINKKLPGTIQDMRMRALADHPCFSTGSFVVDWVTGIGGLPRGKYTELSGLQSSGKTTLALMAAAECQAEGLGVLIEDFEHSIDPRYAEILGVSLDPDLLAVHQPSSLEDGFRIAEAFMQRPGCGMVITDSVAAMVPQAELEGEIADDGSIGLRARKLGKAISQLKHLVAVSNCAFVFINQLRDVVDLTWAGQQAAKRGKQYTTPGGMALKFFADLRLEFMPTGVEKIEQDTALTLKDREGKDKVVIGQKARVTAIKNKCAAPWRSGEIFLRAGKGIDSTVPCVALAVKYGLIKGGASGYYKIPHPYCDPNLHEQSIHGTETLVAFFEANQPQLELLFKDVWQAVVSMGL